MADIDDKYKRIKKSCEDNFDSWEFAQTVAKIIDEIDKAQAGGRAPDKLRPLIRRELNQAQTQLGPIATIRRPDIPPPPVTPPRGIAVKITMPIDDDAHYDEGDAIELRAEATGGSGTYGFTISVTDSSGAEVHTDNVPSAANIDVNLPNTLVDDTYEILVIATDLADNTKFGRAEKRVIVDPIANAINLDVTGIADGDNWIFGTEKKIDANASGGSSRFDFDVLLRDAGNNVMFNPATITDKAGPMGEVTLPQDLIPGTYQLIVIVTDRADPGLQKTERLSFTIDPMSLQITGIVDGAHILQNTSHNINATVTGGFGSYDYAVTVYNSAGHVIVPTQMVSGRPSPMGDVPLAITVAGTYSIEITADDNAVPGVRATDTITFHVDPPGVPFNLLITRPTPDEKIDEGDSVDFAAFTTGGTPPFEFDMSIVDAVTKNPIGWSHNQPMSPATSVSTPMPGTLIPGKYTLLVGVTDSSTPPVTLPIRTRDFEIIASSKVGPATWNPKNKTFFKKVQLGNGNWNVIIHGAKFWVANNTTDIFLPDKKTKVGEQEGDIIRLSFNGHKWIFHLESGQLFMDNMNNYVSFKGVDYKGKIGPTYPIVNIEQDSLVGIIATKLIVTLVDDNKLKLPKGWKWVFRADEVAAYNGSRNLTFLAPMQKWNLKNGRILLFYGDPTNFSGFKQEDRSILIQTRDSTTRVMVDRDNELFLGLEGDWYPVKGDRAVDSDGKEVAEVKRSTDPKFPFDVIILLTKRKKGVKKKVSKHLNHEIYDLLDVSLFVDINNNNVYLNNGKKVGKKVGSAMKFTLNGEKYLYSIGLNRLFWKDKKNEVQLDSGFDMKHPGGPIYPIIDYRKVVVGAVSSGFVMHSVAYKTGVFNIPKGYVWTYINKMLAIVPRGALSTRSAYSNFGPTLLSRGLSVYYGNYDNELGKRDYNVPSINFKSMNYDFYIDKNGVLYVKADHFVYHKVEKGKIIDRKTKKPIGEVKKLATNAKYPYEVVLKTEESEVEEEKKKYKPFKTGIGKSIKRLQESQKAVQDEIKNSGLLVKGLEQLKDNLTDKNKLSFSPFIEEMEKLVEAKSTTGYTALVRGMRDRMKLLDKRIIGLKRLERFLPLSKKEFKKYINKDFNALLQKNKKFIEEEDEQVMYIAQLRILKDADRDFGDHYEQAHEWFNKMFAAAKHIEEILNDARGKVNPEATDINNLWPGLAMSQVLEYQSQLIYDIGEFLKHENALDTILRKINTVIPALIRYLERIIA